MSLTEILQVVVSYIIGLGLAILHGSVLLFKYLISAFRGRPMFTSFIAWLEKYQETGLWSELLFSFSFTVACCVNAFQPHLPTYDSAVISYVISINLTSL